MKRILTIFLVSLFVGSVLAATSVDSLTPGKNCESLHVSGTATPSASITLSLRDRTADTAAISAVVKVGGDGKFTCEFTGLISGHEYAVSAGSTELATALLAHDITEGWVREDSATYVGTSPGTGNWGGDGVAKVVESRIVIVATNDSELAQRVFFAPTNSVSAAAGYRIFTDMKFEGVADAPRPTDGIFGVTLAVDSQDSSKSVFYIIDNRTWKRTDIVGKMSVAYGMEILVDETNRRVGYYLTDSTSRKYLGTGRIPAGVTTRFNTVDFQGHGSVAALNGEVCDTSLITAKIRLDGEESGSLTPGCNFTNLALRGSIAITNLWDTDINSGTFEVRIRDADGEVRTLLTDTWSGFDGIYGITNLVDGLLIGSSYTVEVRVLDSAGKSDRVASDGLWLFRGTMGRKLGTWYDENARTISGRSPTTGVWMADKGVRLTAESGDTFVTVTDDGSETDAKASFTPINSVPANGWDFVSSFDVIFPEATAPAALPSAADELFGLTVVEVDGTNRLAVVVAGDWQILDPKIFAPEIGRRYGFDIVCCHADQSHTIEYFVRDVDGNTRLLKQGALTADGPYPLELALRGNGRFASVSGRFYDTTLTSVSITMDGRVGTNFTAVALSGELIVNPVWETDLTNGVIRAVVRNSLGATVLVRNVPYHGSGPIAINLDGLESGVNYLVSMEITNTDGPTIGGAGTGESGVIMAKQYDGIWIRENTNTFSDVGLRTGEWRYRTSPSPTARVLGENIRIEAALTDSVTFDPTNSLPSVVNSTIREVRFDLRSEKPGYYLSAPDFTAGQSADLAGVTIACDDLNGGKCYFSVYDPEDGGSWHVVSEVAVETNRHYTVVVVISYPKSTTSTPGSVTYYLEESDSRRKLSSFSCAKAISVIGTDYRTRVRFTGNGDVRQLDGVCYDAHTVAIEGGEEYWTVDEAIREIGMTGKVLVPLWYCSGTITSEEGRFGVCDLHEPSYLNLIWPMGYAVQVSESGDVRYYAYNLSDYWVDWADASAVIRTAEGYEITNANGLAWIARESATRPLSDRIALKADISGLSAHIWKPIQGFSGVFDGNSHTLFGLTDKSCGCAVTNANGMTFYGLFGVATNAVFRNVAFRDISITNSADAVAALLGGAVGNLAVTNVFVISGGLAGGGRFVSGVVGYADELGEVNLSGNLNAVVLASTNAASCDVNIAGIANLGIDSGVPAGLSVVANENRGALIATVDLADGDGNVAQVVAGSDAAAQFDPEAMEIRDNIGTGDVSRVQLRNLVSGSSSALPIVNLASAIAYNTDDGGYSAFIEANDSKEKLIDPYKLTARMSSAYYPGGVTNYAGMLNDRISMSQPGETVKLDDDLVIWSSIVLDRAITLDLNDHYLDNVFDTFTFNVPSETITVKNGTVTYPQDKLSVGSGTLNWVNVTKKQWTCNYWERTLLVNGEFLDLVSLPLLKQALSAGASISVPEDSAFSIDADSGTLKIDGEKFVSFVELGYTVRTEQDGGDTVYVVEIDPNPATSAEISLAISPNGGSSKVVVNGARADCEYCLQSVTSLAEDWDKASDEWISPSSDGAVLEFTVDTSASSGFYRIKTKKK